MTADAQSSMDQSSLRLQEQLTYFTLRFVTSAVHGRFCWGREKGRTGEGKRGGKRIWERGEGGRHSFEFLLR